MAEQAKLLEVSMAELGRLGRKSRSWDVILRCLLHESELGTHPRWAASSSHPKLFPQADLVVTP